MRKRCGFCSSRARYSYDDEVRFCYWHMIWFYLGLHLDDAHD